MLRLRLLLIVSIFLVGAMLPIPSSAVPEQWNFSRDSRDGTAYTDSIIPPARAVLVYYGGHTADIDSRIQYIRPALLVTNTPSDYWHSDYALKDMNRMQNLGIKVFGFTTASYESMEQLPDGRSQESCVRTILEADGADGVFMDESSAWLDAARISYHQRFASITHSYGKLYYVNTGVNDFDERWFTEVGADFVNGTEHWHTPGYPNTAYDPSPIQAKYGSSCTVLGFPTNDLDSAYHAITDAYTDGLAYAYENSGEYLSIASYWEVLADRLRTGDIFFDSFEDSTLASWSQSSAKDWVRSSQRTLDGRYSLEVDGWIRNTALTLKQPLNLSACSTASLSFSWYIEGSVDYGEYLALDLWNGSTWTEVARLRGDTDPEDKWVQVSIDLGAYLANGFKMRFRAQISSESEDANIDNLRINGS